MGFPSELQTCSHKFMTSFLCSHSDDQSQTRSVVRPPGITSLCPRPNGRSQSRRSAPSSRTSLQAYPSITKKAVIRSSATSMTFAGIENRILAHPKSLSTPLNMFPGPRYMPCCAKRVKKSCSSSMLCACFASLAKTKMPSVGVTNVTSNCRRTPARRW
jgi:hypothetical protein